MGFIIGTRQIFRCCFTKVDSKFLKQWTILCLLTFLCFLPTICVHFRFSIYSKIFKENKTERQIYLNRENDQRIELTNTILSNLKSHQNQEGQSVDVGLTIITVSRRHSFDDYEPMYLSQVVAHTLHYLEISHPLKLKYQIYLCNVDEEPSTFDEALNLSQVVTMFHRFPTDSFSHRRTISSRLEKEKEDYIYCGEQTLLQNVSYVFLVEDDALPHKDLFVVLDHLLTTHEKLINAIYIKFYHPDRLLGYISLELERIPELIGLSMMSAALLVATYRRCRSAHNTSHVVLWAASISYFLLVFLAIGRQNVSEMRRLSKYLYQITPAASCCTPANLYPRHGMEQIINHLRKVRCYHKFGKDTAIDQFRQQSKVEALMVQPNLFKHIGMYSSLRDNLVNPFIV